MQDKAPPASVARQARDRMSVSVKCRLDAKVDRKMDTAHRQTTVQSDIRNDHSY